MKDRIVITGGSGFLGTNLAHALAESGNEVSLVSRNAPRVAGPWRHVTWDARTLEDWVGELEGAAGVVNLAGRSVDCIKSPDNCDVILRSRVETTKLIGRALREVKAPPPVWVQMSTAHIYGDPPRDLCTEKSTIGYGFAPFVGQAWEQAFEEAVLPEMRQVILRTSFVLGRTGGALPRLAFLTRIFLGGRVGHGRQGISWLHQEDMNRIFCRTLTDPDMKGMYIATAPNPVSHGEFMQHLRKAMGIPFGLPAFSWMVKRGAPLVMKTDPELALYGRYCVSTRLHEEGFDFKFPDIESALQNLYGRGE